MTAKNLNLLFARARRDRSLQLAIATFDIGRLKQEGLDDDELAMLSTPTIEGLAGAGVRSSYVLMAMAMRRRGSHGPGGGPPTREYFDGSFEKEA